MHYSSYIEIEQTVSRLFKILIFLLIFLNENVLHDNIVLDIVDKFI